MDTERHFTAGDTVRDIVIGMSDGLTVPFALAAGLTGAIQASGLVLTAGFAEIAAGSIAMGLGGYLAARGDQEYYERERRREYEEVKEKPEVEKQEVRDALTSFGLTSDEAEPVVQSLATRPDAWVDFMMRYELGLEKPDPARAPKSAGTIAASYIVGGLVPLAPYIIIHTAREALPWSAGVTLLALLVFGAVKGRVAGVSASTSALQTVLVGGLAATVAFFLARLFA